MMLLPHSKLYCIYSRTQSYITITEWMGLSKPYQILSECYGHLFQYGLKEWIFTYFLSFT